MKKRRYLISCLLLCAVAAALLLLNGHGRWFYPEEAFVSVSYWFLAVFLLLCSIFFVGVLFLDRLCAQKNSENAYKKLAMTDMLTQIGNRFGFREFLDQSQGAPLPENLIVLFMDVDGLKRVNDRFGHAAGDEVLVAAAEQMNSIFGKVGSCFRIGGDEFFAAVYLEKDALHERLSAFYRGIDAWRGRSISGFTVSVGFAAAADYPGISLEDLIKIADRSMYANKAHVQGETIC